MNFLIALWLGAFGSAPKEGPFDIYCVQEKGHETVGMWATAEINGELAVKSHTLAEFSEVDFEYNIFWDESLDEDTLWSAGGQSYEGLQNSQSYNPRKYKDHIKFSVWVNGSYSDGEGYGDLDLILPKKNIFVGEGSERQSEFTGYLIMTWMDDHWGGTIPLNCSIE